MIGKVLTSIKDEILIDVEDISKLTLEDIGKRKYKIFFNRTNVGYVFNIIGRVDKPYLIGKITSNNLDLTGKSLEIVLTNVNKKHKNKKGKKNRKR